MSYGASHQMLAMDLISKIQILVWESEQVQKLVLKMERGAAQNCLLSVWRAEETYQRKSYVHQPDPKTSKAVINLGALSKLPGRMRHQNHLMYSKKKLKI